MTTRCDMNLDDLVCNDDEYRCVMACIVSATRSGMNLQRCALTTRNGAWCSELAGSDDEECLDMT